ncbi:hypothetical protein [Mycobacterium sp. 360MFTsu5.1]|uniref:hypothetical protein n=1 Tax=Mycobacterium sp. 360MFTsu5.1 TaxID=1172186 RepID=UPI0012DC45D5|nr:hypothetical protein [Mycobacterium sp. 360MFTsu5.1]
MVADTVLGTAQAVTDTESPPSSQPAQVQTLHEAMASNPVVAQPITSAIQRAAADDVPVLDTPRTAPVIESGQPESMGAHADAGFSGLSADDAVHSTVSLPSPDNPPSPISAAVPVKSQPVAKELQRSQIGDSSSMAAAAGRVDVPEAPAKVQRFASSTNPPISASVRPPVQADPLAPEVTGSATPSFEPVSFEPRSIEPVSTGPVMSTVQRSVAGDAGDTAAIIQQAVMPVAETDQRNAMTSSAPGISLPGDGSSTGFSAPVEIQRSASHIDPTESAFETVAAPAASASPSPADDPVDVGSRWVPAVFEPWTDGGNAEPARFAASPVIPTAPTLPARPAGIAAPIAQRSVMPESRGMPQSRSLPEARISSPAPRPSALPMIQRAVPDESANLPGQFSEPPASSGATAVPGTPLTTQRTVGGVEPGRIVLLPPIRTEQPEPPVRAREVLADSARPMSLQRMFGDFAQPMAEPDTRHTPVDGERSSVRTVTFDSPVAQREMQSAPDPVVQAAAENAPPQGDAPTPGAPAAAAASGHAPSPKEVDELVGRLYEPLAARLRAELWLDRERAGALMGLHR